MTSAKKCMICRTSEEDPLNLGEMKTYADISAHYYCLLLSSTIKQSGADDEGILGFLPSDIKDEVTQSQKRKCSYCGRCGASVICSTKGCKIVFHLPCGIRNESGHQFHDSFLSNCRSHRPKQKFKTPREPQVCPICYENINFKLWSKVLWAPCCKKQSFFHKPCIQQMALSAGYFFKCPMCNNCEVFQKAMRHFGVFIPDQDASWELEPDAFRELLYRHRECNAKICLSKNGRDYCTFGHWDIVLCCMCGSQGTHRHCSKLKKNEDWICSLCVVDKNAPTTPKPQVINGVEIIPTFQPSTSNQNQVQQPQQQQQTPNNLTERHPQPKKRKRHFGSDFIEIDSEDSDVVIIEEEPISKYQIAQDRSLLKIRNTKPQPPDVEIENQDSSSCSGFMNLVITDVRSLSETKEEFFDDDDDQNDAETKNNDYKNNIVLSATVTEQVLQPQVQQQQQQQQQHQQQHQQQYVFYKNTTNNNNNTIYQQTLIHQQMGCSSSSDDIVIID